MTPRSSESRDVSRSRPRIGQVPGLSADRAAAGAAPHKRQLGTVRTIRAGRQVQGRQEEAREEAGHAQRALPTQGQEEQAGRRRHRRRQLRREAVGRVDAGLAGVRGLRRAVTGRGPEGRAAVDQGSPQQTPEEEPRRRGSIARGAGAVCDGLAGAFATADTGSRSRDASGIDRGISGAAGRRGRLPTRCARTLGIHPQALPGSGRSRSAAAAAAAPRRPEGRRQGADERTGSRGHGGPTARLARAAT